MSTNTSTGAGAGILTVRLGTRASALALAQSRMVARDLRAAAARTGAVLRIELVTVRTRGDVDPTALARLGGAGVFAAALRTALLDGECDLAVHSFKDLPTADAPGLTVAAVPAREDPRDALCLRPPGRAGSGGRADRGPGAGRAGADRSTGAADPTGPAEAPGPAGLTGLGGPAGLVGLTGLGGSTDLTGLRPGARVGTGSPRRAAQLLSIRPDLEIVEIRGNVPTRLARVVGSVVSPDGPMGAVREPDLDAVVLALAGLRRLGLEAYASRILAAAPAEPARTARPGEPARPDEPADRPDRPGRAQCADHSARPGPARSAGADPEPVMVPAPAQGALAVETREDVATRLPGLAAALAALDDPPTRAAVTAERSLMAHLGAGCAAPVGALARSDDGGGSGGDGGGDGSAARLRLDALVASPDGARRLVVREAGSAREAEALGARAARSLLEAGAAGIADLRAGRAGGSIGGRR